MDTSMVEACSDDKANDEVEMLNDDVDAQIEKRKEIESFMKDITILNVYEKNSNLNDQQLDMMEHSELRSLAGVWCDFSGDDPGMLAGSKSDLELAFGMLKKKLCVESQAERWNKKVEEMGEIDQHRMLRLDFSKVDSVNDLKELSKQVLITYLYFNSAGTCITDHKLLFHTSHEYISEQVIEAIQFQREESKPPTIADSLFYIKSSTMEEDEFRSTEFLQQHVRNWIKHKGKAYQGIDPADDCRDILLNILDDGRDEIKENTPPPFKVDDIIINMDADMEDKKQDKESCKDDDEEIIKNRDILDISDKVTDFQIQKLNQKELASMYRKYLLKNSIEHKTESIVSMENQQLLDAIQLVRDAMLQKNRQMDAILENKGQDGINLLIDVPDITSDLKDRTIDNMESKMLAKVFYKYNKKIGKAQGISSYFVWSDETLKKAIRKQRNILQANSKTTSILKSSENSNSISKKKSIKQSNLKGKVYNSMRYSFTFELEESGTPAMREYLIRIFQQMQNIVEGISFLPWSTIDFANPIVNEEDFPETISQLQKYFKDIRPNNNGPIWTKIRIGLPVTADRQTFQVDFSAWGSNQKIRLYECPVQHLNFRTCGWLAYMPRTVNPKVWSSTVQRMYESTYKTPGASILVGLSWRSLNGQKNVERAKKVYAMHVEAPVGQAVQVKKFLRILSKKKIWPLGVRFRLFAEYHQYMKEINQKRYRYLLDHHKTLIKQLKEFSTPNVLELDKKIPKTNVTLREVVIQIRDHTDERRLFASIDEKYNSSSDFVAIFRPDKTSMAKEFLESLPTYVLRMYPSADLSGIFTIDAIESVEMEQYDPTTQQFTTQEDNDLRETMEYDRDDDSFEFLNEHMDPEVIAQFNVEFDVGALISNDDEKIKGGSRLFDFSGEQDTITTAASLGNTSQVSFNGASRHVFDQEACSSSITSTSSHSKDKQIDEMEKLLQETEKSLKNSKSVKATSVTNVQSKSSEVAENK